MRKIFTFLVVLLTALSINAAEFREIKDISGDIVKVPANIEKIATLWYANNQIVLMLGGLIR
jgi:ABC transporter, substrate-binding protein